MDVHSELDSDSDGITDDIDICENTPSNADVDEFGCADIDSDGEKRISTNAQEHFPV